jgi:hypothetical protein
MHWRPIFQVGDSFHLLHLLHLDDKLIVLRLHPLVCGQVTTCPIQDEKLLRDVR